MLEVSASMLSSDFSCLAQEVEKLHKGGAHRFHWDMMDGTYVPNLTFGPLVMKSVRPLTSLPFDVHLMVHSVETLIPLCVQSGADSLSFHPETVTHPYKVIQQIQTYEKKAGIALNPGTSLATVEALLPLVDFILVMTVNPGFGGQKFLSDQLEKIRELKKWSSSKTKALPIQVDGGISPQTAPLVHEAGAQVLVAGSSLFSSSLAYDASIRELLSSCREKV